MIVRELLASLGFKVDPKGIDDWEKRIERNKKLMEGLKNASAQVGSVLASVAKAGAVGFAGLAVAAAKAGGEFESLRASLKTVTGSTEAANKAFGQIRDFATKTPYSVKEITQAFIKLKALGLDPSERALKSYGNTSSAMGKSLMEMIEAVADASTGEFERLKEFGIKASSQGDQVSLTFQGVTTTIKKDAASIQEYLLKIGETNFAGAMDEQSKTLNGAFSNIGDAVEGFLDQVNQAGLGEALGEIARDIAGITGESGGLAKTLGESLAKAVRELWARFKQFIPTIPMVVRQFGELASVALKLADVALKIVNALGGPGNLIPTLLLLKGTLGGISVAMSGMEAASKLAAGGMSSLALGAGALGVALTGAVAIIGTVTSKIAAMRAETAQTLAIIGNVTDTEHLKGLTDTELEDRRRQIDLKRRTEQARLDEAKKSETFMESMTGGKADDVALRGFETELAGLDAEISRRSGERKEKADALAGFVTGLGDDARARTAEASKRSELATLVRKSRRGLLKPSEKKRLTALQKELDITVKTGKGKKAKEVDFDAEGYERALDAYKSMGIKAPHNLRASYTSKHDKKKHLGADELLAKDFGGGVTAQGKIVDSARAQLGTTINRIDNSYSPKVDVQVNATQAAGEDGGTFAQRVADIAKSEIERTVLRPGYDHFLGAVTG